MPSIAHEKLPFWPCGSVGGAAVIISEGGEFEPYTGYSSGLSV